MAEKLYVLYNPDEELYLAATTSASPAFQNAALFSSASKAEKFLHDDAWMAIGRFSVYSFEIKLDKVI